MLDKIMALGEKPDEDNDLRAKRRIFMPIFFGVLFVFISFIAPLYLFFGEVSVGLLYIMYPAFSVINLLVYAKWHGDFYRFLNVQAAVTLPAHLLVVLYLGGVEESAGLVLWGLNFPVLIMLIFFGIRAAVIWFMFYVLNVLLATFAAPMFSQSNQLPPFINQILFATNLLLMSSTIVALLAYILQQRDLAFRLLRGEQEKAENLLLNILPADIAAILKEEQRTVAEHYNEASILFADIVNFTPLSASMSPVELVELLNDVFSYFDGLVERYGLEKIKTIGDCYMVAAGVPRFHKNHAHDLTQMALEIRDYMAQNEFRGRKLSFRMGINSGDVVAGVIGRKKFIYDLWGDAVNTASRMESHGSGGSIQVTKATYELIRDSFNCESKGIVQIKGKGEMEVFTVIGKSENQ